jgi:hypothetical protein
MRVVPSEAEAMRNMGCRIEWGCPAMRNRLHSATSAAVQLTSTAAHAQCCAELAAGKALEKAALEFDLRVQIGRLANAVAFTD